MTTSWTNVVDTWLAANKDATTQQIADAAKSAGGSYDVQSGTFSFGGSMYNPTISDAGNGLLNSLSSSGYGPTGSTSSATYTPTTAATVPQPSSGDTFSQFAGISKTAAGDLYNYWNTAPGEKEANPDFTASLQKTYANPELDTYYSDMNQANYDALISADPTLAPYITKPKAALPAGYSTTSFNANPVHREVDAPTETIEGRIQNLLDQNNPVIRQAGDRAMAQFAQRGLLNSSMAVQAANEAMIAKAIEIAGPDAQSYFTQGRANQDAQNKFGFADLENQYAVNTQQRAFEFDKQLRELDLSTTDVANLKNNYLTDQRNAQSELNSQITNIQIQNMDAAQKSAAIAEAYRMYDTRITLLNETYLKMPTFQTEWVSVPNSLYDQYSATGTSASS